MRHLLPAFGLVALATTAPAADDQNFRIDTAAQLAALCASTPDHRNYAAAIHMCHGYMVGVHHMHVAIAAATEEGVYCLPAEGVPSRDAVVAAFVSWMAAHPGMAGREALDATLEFAAETYPCQ